MYKLGFVVGHPTQFESPFYQYIARETGHDSICVYYHDYVSPYYKDPELNKATDNSYGIDLLTGYAWRDVTKFSFKSVFEIIKSSDYIIVNGYNYTMILAILFFAKLKGKKIGLRMDSVLWNNTSMLKKTIKKLLVTILSLFVDTFWVTGTKATEYLEYLGISSRRIKIFTYVVDVAWFKAKSETKPEENEAIRASLLIPARNKVLMCATKLMPRENPIELINAFDQLNSKDTTLLILGDGVEKVNLMKHVKDTLKNENIIFGGFVKYVQLPNYYSIADVFIHPVKDEPWGVSVQEAMACGLPVISSNFVGAAFDLIDPGKNGLMYDYGNVAELKAAIQEVLRWDTGKIKANNQAKLKEWNYQATWDRLEDHIDNLN